MTALAAQDSIMAHELLEHVENSTVSDLNKNYGAFLKQAPALQAVFNKSTTDVLEEVTNAKNRITQLLEADSNAPVGSQADLLKSTGILLMISRSKEEYEVIGMQSCVCIDQNSGLFITNNHMFQPFAGNDCAVLLSPDGKLAAVQRILLRNTNADALLFTTRSAHSGQIMGVGLPPKVGDMMWIVGSSPGATFVQLGSHVARSKIANHEAFGKLRTRWFDLDRGVHSGTSGGAVFNRDQKLTGLVCQNITVSSQGNAGAPLYFTRAVELHTLLSELR